MPYSGKQKWTTTRKEIVIGAKMANGLKKKKSLMVPNLTNPTCGHPNGQCKMI